jgi:hypothetical protein
MTTGSKPRRLRVVISDEETGEEVASAEGVETLIILIAPDESREGYRRILLGDPETSVQLLFDILQDVSESMERGTMLDLTEVLDDRLLLEVTEELPMH